MENYNIYEDISSRTNGDIYLGVVGPVRCGKSTFITKFMNLLVLPNVTNKFSKERTIDELPQSGDGKTVMTTQPKFVPNEAVKIQLNDKLEMNVRMIDCVGYMIDGAIGSSENDQPRMIKTPWSDEEMSFEKAAELGTKKVIEDHSTVAVLMTTDGSITDIPRSSYIPAEERIVNELKQKNKPFVIILNSVNPADTVTKSLASTLEQKYGVPVLALNVASLETEDVTKIFENMLTQFPLVSIQVKLPTWLQALPFENQIIQQIITEISSSITNVEKVGDYNSGIVLFEDSDKFEPLVVQNVKMGEGKIVFEVVPKEQLFYIVISDQCGVEIANDFELVKQLKELTYAKKEYDKIKSALAQVDNIGYGVVYPSLEEMTLEEPKIVKQGNRSGVRLKASAPSLHIMKVDIETEINPVVGTEQQSEDLVKYLLSEFENNPKNIWNTNMFGVTLQDLVKEGINNKLSLMPVDVQKKMRKTLYRVINEGKGGVICILL